MILEGCADVASGRTNNLDTHPYSHYTVKKVSDFSVPSRDVTYQTLPAGNNLIIPCQGVDV
jgi:hypothetical protein